MKIEIKYKASDNTYASELRGLICQAQLSRNHDCNPLLNTKFNDFLDLLVQTAFDEGRRFQKENPKTSDY